MRTLSRLTTSAAVPALAMTGLATTASSAPTAQAASPQDAEAAGLPWCNTGTHFPQYLAPDGSRTGHCIMGQGAQGQAAETLQKRLNTNCSAGPDEDGIYGPATTQAVRDVQAFAGITVDGWYGPETKDAIWYSNC